MGLFHATIDSKTGALVSTGADLGEVKHLRVIDLREVRTRGPRRPKGGA